MSEYQDKTRAILDELQTASQSARTMQELEQLVIEYERRLAKTAFEELAADLAARTSPPRAPLSAMPSAARSPRPRRG